MTTALDTNIIIALWDHSPMVSNKAYVALHSARNHGRLVVAAPVVGELLAGPGRDEEFIDRFFEETGILPDWDLGETIWRAAGRAFQGYAASRRKQREVGPRRILTDFVIGAHAHQRRARLLTFDEGVYRAAFPQLVVVRP